MVHGTMVDNSIAEIRQIYKTFPSIRSRNIKPEAFRVYGVYFNPRLGLVMPYFVTKTLAPVQIIRTISGKPKYLILPERSSIHLYGYYQIATSDGPVLLFESPLDVLAAYPRPAVALVGVRISSIAVSLLAHMRRPVVVALDPDMTGVQAQYDVARRLTESGVSVLISYKYLQAISDYDIITEQVHGMRPGSMLIGDR